MSIWDKLNSGKTYIIAEAGVNHGGDIALAKKLIGVAKLAGADAVKFQAFRTEHLILDNVEKAPYQKSTTNGEQTQSDMLRALELRNEHYAVLKEYCEEQNIAFLITPFDEYSLVELEELGVEAYKIASTDTTNIPFLRKVAATQKPIILSTGMCDFNEVKVAMEAVSEINQNIVLMQCTANYPIDDSEANLNVLHTYANAFDCVLGYSDHTVGLGASLYAVPMGAKVVEKHFTLDRDADGPDHLASLNPEELTEYVAEIRRIEKMMGSFEKFPTEAEKHTKKSLQKCLVAATDIKEGELFDTENLVAKRTGGKGISPVLVDALYGKPAKRSFIKNDVIEFDF